MKKIPTIFERDPTHRDRVLNQPNPKAQWVFDGEGIATQKLDGTCAMIRGGKLYKRREIKVGQTAPPDFEQVDHDEETGKTVGWVPVGEGPDDKWLREGLANLSLPTDGTYELIGPKLQGNPEKLNTHQLINHADRFALEMSNVPRDFEGLKAFLTDLDIEGIVFHHPDGRMAKIKKKDFGLRRECTTTS